MGLPVANQHLELIFRNFKHLENVLDELLHFSDRLCGFVLYFLQTICEVQRCGYSRGYAPTYPKSNFGQHAGGSLRSNPWTTIWMFFDPIENSLRSRKPFLHECLHERSLSALDRNCNCLIQISTLVILVSFVSL